MGTEADEKPVDEAEAMGIARSREALADADLVLVVHDATLPLSEGERELLEELEHRPHLLVANKADLPGVDAELWATTLATSTVTGEGMEALRERILSLLGADSALAETAALTTPRQLAAIQAGIQALEQAAEANQAGLPHEVLLVDLHRAREAVDGLTGQTTPDDILQRIFSTFCIGK